MHRSSAVSFFVEAADEEEAEAVGLGWYLHHNVLHFPIGFRFLSFTPHARARSLGGRLRVPYCPRMLLLSRGQCHGEWE